MSTQNVDFRIKNGLIVQGAQGTIGGNPILTTASSIDALQDVNISGIQNTNVLAYQDGIFIPSTGGMGLQGIQGIAGYVGSDGVQGIQGLQGQQGGYSISDTPPTASYIGQTWYNSTNGKTYTWYDNYWIEVGTNVSGVVSATSPLVYDSGTGNISLDQSALTLTESQITNLTTDLSAKAVVLDEVIPTDPTGAYFDGTGLRCYGVNSNFVSVPDSTALSITGDIDIRIDLSLTDWTPSASQYFLGKWNTSNQRSYTMGIGSTGFLTFAWSSAGNNVLQLTSTTAVEFADNSRNWVRATMDVDNGASGYTLTFYTSSDGSTWTQLGLPITNAGVTSIFDSTAVLEVGAYSGGTQAVAGTVYRAIIKNGIDGTTVFDADFSNVPSDSFAFTESSSNAATVTLTTTRYSFGLPGGIYTTSTTTTSANTTYYSAFKVTSKTITVRQLAFEAISAPANTSNARIAIFATDSNMQPTGAAFYDSGAISVSTSAAAVYRVRVAPFALTPGNYVIAFNISVSFQTRVWYTANIYASNILGSNFATQYQVSETLSGSYPNPPTKWNTRNASSPGQWQRVLLGWS